MPASTRSSTLADDVWVVVLAGGVGSRFWPASTPARPKQLLALASDRALIVDTVERARALAGESRLRILAGEHLVAPFREAMPGLGGDAYWVEPRARGTCPVLTWAAWEIRKRNPEGVMISLHADHRIAPLEAFVDTLGAATVAARDHDVLVCVGAEPTRVETGYGHIEPGASLDDAAHRVAAFHEKPDARTAARYNAEGYLWNTGIFVWKAATFLDEVATCAPEVAECLPLLEDGPVAFFEAVPGCVVDKAVMERSDRVATVKATFEWDDVGGWEALARTRPRDAEGNVLVGPADAVDSRRNIVYADEGTVVLYGVDDLVVVRTGDTTMVTSRERAADLKALLRALKSDA